jgi:hypothetical protein
MSDRLPTQPILCPSAQPDMEDAQVIGVFVDTPEVGKRVGYLTEPQPVTADVLAATQPARPTEVLRVAARCLGSGCVHFDGSNCQIAARITNFLDPVVSGLPRCAIRPTCRWFLQEGRAACLRCPQVVTERREGTDLHRQIAGMPIPE